MKTKVDVKCSFKVESYFQGLKTSEYPKHSTGKQQEESLEPIANRKQ